MNYKIYQMKITGRLLKAKDRCFRHATQIISDLSLADYDLVWNEDLEVCQEDFDYLDFLNGVYRIFNIAIPKKFKGHGPITVSDIIELNETLYYIDTFGFVEINDKFEKIRSVP